MWLLILIALIVIVVALVAIPMRYRSRSAGGQNTTIIEREPQPESRETTVVERRYELRTDSSESRAPADSEAP